MLVVVSSFCHTVGVVLKIEHSACRMLADTKMVPDLLVRFSRLSHPSGFRNNVRVFFANRLRVIGYVRGHGRYSTGLRAALNTSISCWIPNDWSHVGIWQTTIPRAAFIMGRSAGSQISWSVNDRPP